jgi:hypothetical protein
MEKIRRDGLEILGTCVGPESARRVFLNKKVDAQIAKLEKLSLLSHSQDSLLIFRSSFQQDLRHLQRSLDTSDLGDIWDRLDIAYSKIITNMRSSAGAGPYDSDLITLPLKMGGMGILSHRECSVHARAAANESSDAILAGLLEEAREDGEPDEVRGQGVRCQEAFVARRDALMEKLEDKERKSMRANASELGRKWLSAIPYNSTGQFSDFEISCALHRRTLFCPLGPCSHCANPISLGHDELCRGATRPRFTILRHNGIVNALADCLRTVRGTRVQVEPITTDLGSMRRNDLLVWGSEQLRNATTEHDVKVYSILGEKVHKTTGRMKDGITKAPPPGMCLWDITLWQIQRYLNDIYRETIRAQPGSLGRFSPLVFSSDGLVETETMRRLEEWKKVVSGNAWEYMIRRMSVGLVRAMAKTWEAWG